MSVNRAASDLEWSELKQQWYYDDLTLGGLRSAQRIPTLSEWMNEFAGDSRLKLIWLDVKVQDLREIDALTRSVSALLQHHHVHYKRVQFSAHQEGRTY